MQGKDNSKAIALSILIVGAIGAIVYFFLKKKKIASPVSDQNLKVVYKAPATVKDQVLNGYNKGFATLTEAEIKRYATWFDRLEQIVLSSPKKGKYQTVTAEAISNAEVLNKISKDNLRAVIAYWENARGRSIKTNAAMDMVYDETSTIPILTQRVNELLND